MVRVAAENGWEMIVKREVAEDPEERAKVVEALRLISEIGNDEGDQNE